ncbi:hypothetical protein Lfu02_77880 [Longispora fulva]|uniref:Uncharacterized protein n=1 Tax=Longispora fulva TaxID=619741 RepID=A0A8J7GE75_9ACTN|nr:hypothetical protein [Longispora fulva]MBG6136235.1 hypothetical protein [Longispora fulva]GIG63416.1 hypothetical protein Lfu02_77880 [Longispora fulva]
MLGGILMFLHTANGIPAGLTRKEIDDDVVQVRNRAIHKGHAPTPVEAEAKAAVECVARVVTAVLRLH